LKILQLSLKDIISEKNIPNVLNQFIIKVIALQVMPLLPLPSFLIEFVSKLKDPLTQNSLHKLHSLVIQTEIMDVKEEPFQLFWIMPEKKVWLTKTVLPTLPIQMLLAQQI